MKLVVEAEEAQEQTVASVIADDLGLDDQGLLTTRGVDGDPQLLARSQIRVPLDAQRVSRDVASDEGAADAIRGIQCHDLTTEF